MKQIQLLLATSKQPNLHLILDKSEYSHWCSENTIKSSPIAFLPNIPSSVNQKSERLPPDVLPPWTCLAQRHSTNSRWISPDQVLELSQLSNWRLVPTLRVQKHTAKSDVALFPGPVHRGCNWDHMANCEPKAYQPSKSYVALPAKRKSDVSLQQRHSILPWS
jgi:hypothetical protein